MGSSDLLFLNIICILKLENSLINWNKRNHHSIDWSDVDATIQNLHRQLPSIFNNSVVCVNGLEKAKYVEELFTPEFVIDFEYYPPLKDLPRTSSVYCFFYKDSKLSCSLNNVLKFVKYKRFKLIYIV